MDTNHKHKSTNVEHGVHKKKARSNNKMVFNLSRIDYSNLKRKLRLLSIINTRFHTNTTKQTTRKRTLHREESIGKWKKKILWPCYKYIAGTGSFVTTNVNGRTKLLFGIISTNSTIIGGGCPERTGVKWTVGYKLYCRLSWIPSKGTIARSQCIERSPSSLSSSWSRKEYSVKLFGAMRRNQELPNKTSHL